MKTAVFVLYFMCRIDGEPVGARVHVFEPELAFQESCEAKAHHLALDVYFKRTDAAQKDECNFVCVHGAP